MQIQKEKKKPKFLGANISEGQDIFESDPSFLVFLISIVVWKTLQT